MNKRQYHIRMQVFLPAVLGGLVVLASLVAFNIASGKNDIWLLGLWLVSSAALSVGIGYLGVSRYSHTLDKFLEHNFERTPLPDANPGSARALLKEDEFSAYRRRLDQISVALSQVDADAMFPEIVGSSKALRRVLKQVTQVALTDATALIYGESGTGKELVAHSIHRNSTRSGKPYVVLNCAAIPEGLLESEIFGHEKGAFTDADQAKPGKAELADGGTLFLDEIAEIPYSLQAKLLRFLQDKKVERIGSLEPRAVNVRIIAATNKNLDQVLAAGEFREDLYYRINVFNIYLPPLRERSEDIPVLVNHFLSGLAGETRVSPEAMEMLMTYHWPGNVRELENVVKTAAVMSEDGVIKPDHLPAHLAAGHDNVQPGFFSLAENGGSLDEYLDNLEKNIIVRTLHHTGGVQVKAAELLGITQRSLWHRVKKYQLDVTQFKKN